MKNYSFNQTLFVLYYMLCFLHISTCLICLTARIDPKPTAENGLGWFNYIGFNKYPHTIYDIYREALCRSLMAMLGLSDGTIIATTNLEYFVLTCWFVAGASLLIGYFSWLVSEWSLRNL
jgi:hypothetical protein